MGAAAFNRRRRILAQQKAEAEAKVLTETKNTTESDTEPENMGQTESQSEPLDIENMDIDQVRAELDKLGVKYAHNTGEAKLKERLTNAING